jgi:ABC-2 type transport system permease protein
MKKSIINFNKYIFLLKELIKRDFKVKYKRSFLGVIWSILYPLLMMSVMAIVFSNMFKFKMEGVNFLAYLMSGLIIFNFFSEATNNTLTAVLGNGALINKIYMPKYIFPLAKVLFAGINFLFTLIPFFLIVFLSGNVEEGTKCYINIYYLWMPYIFLCTLIFTVGIGFILSTVTVFVRDVIYIWGVCLTILNYVTPIFYSIQILPEKVHALFKFNPLYVYINGIREVVLFGNPLTPTYLLTMLLYAILAFVIGLFIFKRKQDSFVYYI